MTVYVPGAVRPQAPAPGRAPRPQQLPMFNVYVRCHFQFCQAMILVMTHLARNRNIFLAPSPPPSAGPDAHMAFSSAGPHAACSMLPRWQLLTITLTRYALQHPNGSPEARPARCTESRSAGRQTVARQTSRALRGTRESWAVRSRARPLAPVDAARVPNDTDTA